MKRKIVIYILCTIFLGGLIATYIPIAHAEVNIVEGLTTDTCNKLNISATDNPDTARLTQNVQYSCPVQTSTMKNRTGSYSLTVKVTSADGKPHTFKYTIANQWCTAGYLKVDPASGWCACNDNNIQTTKTVTTPATITTKRQPVAPYTNCGTYQMDFGIQSVDGNTSCNYGQQNGNLVGLAGTAETGVTCPVPTTAIINAVVFVDNDDNGVFSTGDTYYQGAKVTMSGTGSGTTNAQGATSFTAKPGNYTLTLTIPAGYQMTTTNPVTIAVPNTQTQQVNFGIRKIPTYTISGNMFNDSNKNGLIDNGETNYSGSFSISVSPNIGITTTNPNGSYTITNLLPGTYTVSLLSIPSGYKMTSPLNGPPPSFKVTVGQSCTTNGAPGATCQ